MLIPPSLELAMVGNGSIAALLDARGEMVWACLPRMDGDTVMCSLLHQRRNDVPDETDCGFFSIDLDDCVRTEQEYLPNTAIVITRLFDARGGAVEICDLAPRFRQFGRMFSPMSLMRQIRPLSGTPRITVRLRPAHGYGEFRAGTTFGSNHVRYLCGDFVLRATTDCSITALVEEVPFILRGALSFVLGPDETLQGSAGDVARRFREETTDYWHDWVRDLSIPFEWQEAVIRAAITLKLSALDDTGAIVAAITTSLPEAAGTSRNWDYRFCWLRDACFTVNALNRLNATKTMERYLGFIINMAANAGENRLQPVYRINGRAEMPERELDSLPGYRGIGPVRIGNQAALQIQHDVYGATVLAATHVFFDRRLLWPGNEALFAQMEVLGEHAAELWDEPDAGLWELRGTLRVHTYSSVMCWAACDRLARIASRLELPDRAFYWRHHADIIHKGIWERAWNARLNSFTATLDGEGADASLLLLAELGFLEAGDPRFAGTVAYVERELRRGDFVFRYAEADDFGLPKNAFLVCTFWYIDALILLGRHEEARRLFENLLSCRNQHGLLAEHVDQKTGELWGNFPQTYSMVGLINSATKLSIPWDQAF
jgi:hypothetical protein